MAVNVTLGTAYRAGTPAPLFLAPGQTTTPSVDVTSDGDRFLFAAQLKQKHSPHLHDGVELANRPEEIA